MQSCDIEIYSFNYFYKNRKKIRNMYRLLSLDEKWKLKRFVYSDNLDEKEIDKDCIWNYLNENENCKKELYNRYLYYGKFRKYK